MRQKPDKTTVADLNTGRREYVKWKILLRETLRTRKRPEKGVRCWGWSLMTMVFGKRPVQVQVRYSGLLKTGLANKNCECKEKNNLPLC